LTNELINTIFDVAAHCKIPTVLIGGFALPAYNVARTTLDIDICIYIKSQDELEQFIEDLKVLNILTKQKPKINQDLFTVFGKFGEAEVWLKPCDSFQWDAQMVEKIYKFYANVFVLAVEDYILTKLARSDRSATDISDILQILIANKDKIDWQYLFFRLNWIGLENDFREILKVFTLDFDKNGRTISEEILNKFKMSKILKNSKPVENSNDYQKNLRDEWE